MHRVRPHIAKVLDRRARQQRCHGIRPQQLAIASIEIGHLAPGPGKRDLVIGIGRCGRAEQNRPGSDAKMHPQLFTGHEKVNLHVAVKVGHSHPVGADDGRSATQRYLHLDGPDQVTGRRVEKRQGLPASVNNKPLRRQRQASADPGERVITLVLDDGRPDRRTVLDVEGAHRAVRRHGIDPPVTDNRKREFGQIGAAHADFRAPARRQWWLQL